MVNTHNGHKQAQNPTAEQKPTEGKEMRYLEFAERLETSIKKAGLWGSRRKMAGTFKVSASTMSNLLTGEKLPSHELAVELAVKLDVDVHWLLTGELTINQRFKDLSPEAQQAWLLQLEFFESKYKK